MQTVEISALMRIRQMFVSNVADTGVDVVATRAIPKAANI